MLLLYQSRRLHPLLRGHRFFTVLQQVVHKLRHISAAQLDLLDARADDIAVGHRHEVRQAITSIYDESREIGLRSRLVPALCPLRVERQHRLDGYVQPFDIEGLKHQLSCQFSILRSVEGWFCQQKQVILGHATQVPEDRLLKEAFNVVPMLNAAFGDRAYQVVRLLALVCLISNVVVSFCEARCLRLAHIHPTRLARRVRNNSRQNILRLGVASVAQLCEARAYVDDYWRVLC
mmetsp:Transcript_83343/g.193660  ORF Transcript_83343/g.193660 Transcript_83343/m.193660 type:complete len:234 (-) Transcript_83343:90-791(-)